MPTKFPVSIPLSKLKELQAAGDIGGIYDILAQPLHEELYRRQTFDFMDELSDIQQLLISYDYVRTQVMQGGFIQLIQNGYIGLLPAMPEWLYKIGAPEMAKDIDDVLKVYVLNRQLLDQKTTVEEFAKLYSELTEFEEIDERFRRLDVETMEQIAGYAVEHPEEFLSESSM